MSWTMDGTLDPDEALRLLDHLSGESGNDFMMLVENKGQVVEGEAKRKFEDGKQRMDIGGYTYLAEVHMPPGATKGQVRAKNLVVVRDCDAATATFASMLKNQDAEIKITVSVFKASGDSSTAQQPTLEFVLEGARIISQAILTGGTPKRPCEILNFAYRSIEIRSAPQQATGLRGAVRTCQMTQG